jgi:damage-control phosphatase, subfamily III
MDLDPPLPKSQTSDPTSFAHTSARFRWPAIITGAIDDVHRTISALPIASTEEQTVVKEGKGVVSSLASLKYELQHNRALTPVPDDGEPDHVTYNDELKARGTSAAKNGSDGGDRQEGVVRWHDVEWLYAECYLYRRINSIFRICKSEFWRSYDCFSRQKMDTFRSSRSAVLELASRYREVVTKLKDEGRVAETGNGGNGNGKGEEAEERAEEVLFKEMAEICLWGNATDLSLLTSLSYEDIQKLQGTKARKESESKILVNDLSKAFEVLNESKKRRSKAEGGNGGRVDFVLDNAGFELFVDFVLAGYLIETGLASEVVMHGKAIPWFVSDVVAKDVDDLLSVLRDPRGFYEDASGAEGREVIPLSEGEVEDLNFLYRHWNGLREEKRFRFRFERVWTGPGSFWRLKEEKGVLGELRGAELVVFKGDLNYRKLTGDVSTTYSGVL